MQLSAAMALISFSLVLFELLLTRLFGVVLFAQFAHLALALLGIGVGATLQHLWPQLMPDRGLERRVGWLALLQALLTVLAVLAVLHFPLVTQWDDPTLNYQERSSIKDDLLDQRWFAALLPVLASPFAAAGLTLAGVFQRRRARIAQLYGADLIGGALGAVVFLPALAVLSGPDVVWVIVAVLGAVAAFCAHRGWAAVSVLGLGLCLWPGSVLDIEHAAGFTENKVTKTWWTPLVRLSVYEEPDRTLVLLDNTSASTVVTGPEVLERLEGGAARSLVYRLEEPRGRVAILAASAGPDVAVALHHGFEEIDAIDVAGGIFELSRSHWPKNPLNPYTHPGVRTIAADGRAAILHADEPYSIIQMVHANLWSSAGLMANAWSPMLLETVQAFDTYLEHLDEDGILSMGRGRQTRPIERAAALALMQRGVKKPWRHIAYIEGHATVLLVRKKPWTEEQRERLVLELVNYPKQRLVHDPGRKPDEPLWKGAAPTDDKPYTDSPGVIKRQIKNTFATATGENTQPAAALYRSIVVQVGFVLMAGLLFVFVPMLRRGPTELAGLRGVGPVLLYVCGLGYGYLAVETVLLHELSLFVGHPTYAVTLVVLAMLLFSGLGSLAAGRVSETRLLLTLRGVLAMVLGLGALQALVVPELLHSLALGLPVGIRALITFTVLAPLGFVMGMPFPLALRLLPERAGGIVPWAWALNGWTSVVAGLATVMLSRAYGYSAAFLVALGAYALALLLAGQLTRIR